MMYYGKVQSTAIAENVPHTQVKKHTMTKTVRVS